MNILFAHPSFPGQFKNIASALDRIPGWHVAGIGRRERIGSGDGGVKLFGYGQAPPVALPDYPPIERFADQLRQGRAMSQHLEDIKRKGFLPDIVVVHPGWGDGLLLRNALPDARLVTYAEFYYRTTGSDFDFDPEFSSAALDAEFVPLRNLAMAQACAESHAVISPTRWQASGFPEGIRRNITILHEGLDTEAVSPDPTARIALSNGQTLNRDREILTYIARDLEPYRGFHVFMRALPEIQRRRPDLFTIIVGGNGVSYGRRPKRHATWREAMLDELKGSLDLGRIWFTGKLPYAQFLDVLRISRVHVYLTYPFVLSWSLLEAMSSGCAIVASDTAPVREFVADGETGLLAPFFDRDVFAGRVAELLANPSYGRALGAAARAHVVAHYDSRTHAVPAYERLLRRVARENAIVS